MRKTIATVVILVLVWIGYTAWPLYDLLVLVHAMETRDVGTVTRHVYFDAVRASLTEQVVAAYVRRTKINISPFAQSMAAGTLGIANPIVQKLISPEALSELLDQPPLSGPGGMLVQGLPLRQRGRRSRSA